MTPRQVSGRDRQRYGHRPVGRQPLASQPLLSRRQRHGVIWTGGVLAGLIILLDIFGVSNITVQGVNAKLQAQVGQEVEAEVRSHWTWGNLITLSSNGIAQAVLTKDYELKSLSVRRQWPHSLVVTAGQKQPAFLWSTGGSKYLLDIDGTIIGAAGAGSEKLPVVTDTSNLPVNVGDRAVPTHFVNFCQSLLTALPRQGNLQVAGFSVGDTTTDVNVALVSKPYVLKFDTTRDAAGQLNDLSLVLAELAKQKKAPAQYIDLRLENKAYYK